MHHFRSTTKIILQFAVCDSLQLGDIKVRNIKTVSQEFTCNRQTIIFHCTGAGVCSGDWVDCEGCKYKMSHSLSLNMLHF